MFAFLGRIVDLIYKICNKLRKAYLKSKFKSIGKNCYIGNYVKLHPETISMGDHVSIGAGSVIQSTHGEIVIGNHVMLGPNVHIHGGNHKIHEIGSYLDATLSKDKNEDGKIIIEDDVWIGACAIILKGVHIGKGCVIGAGSICGQRYPSVQYLY